MEIVREDPDWYLAGQRVALLTTSSLHDLGDQLGRLGEPFVLLLACDAREVSDEALRGAAEAVIIGGLAYLCAWGPGCSWVHDLFDLTFAHLDVAGRAAGEPEADVGTSWHDGQSLEEAFWFFANCAYPDESHPQCSLWVCAVVGDEPEWADRLRLAALA